jgi:hypothetical protein
MLQRSSWRQTFSWKPNAPPLNVERGDTFSCNTTLLKYNRWRRFIGLDAFEPEITGERFPEMGEFGEVVSVFSMFNTEMFNLDFDYSPSLTFPVEGWNNFLEKAG